MATSESIEKETTFALSGDDVALAQEAAALAIAYYRQQPGSRTKWVKSRISAQKALIRKLSSISDYAYPYYHSDEMPLDCGSENILRLNIPVVRSIRKAAAKARGEDRSHEGK